MEPRTFADLRQAGVSKHILAGPRFRRTSPGRYVPARVEQDTRQRLIEAAAHLPVGAALGGWAAAHLLGAASFDGLDGQLRSLPVPLCVSGSLHRRASPAFCYVRQDLADDELADVGGVTVTSPVRTAADLACWAPTVEEAVVALDALLYAGVLRTGDLHALEGTVSRRRGARLARAAFALASTGVRSPGETRLRMVYVLGLGAPTPLVNQPVFDRYGRLLGIPDLLDEGAGLILEYDGARWAGSLRENGHRDRAQHREDNVREEAFERSGLIVVRADAADVGRHRDQLINRMRAARAEGLRGSQRSWRLER